MVGVRSRQAGLHRSKLAGASSRQSSLKVTIVCQSPPEGGRGLSQTHFRPVNEVVNKEVMSLAEGQTVHATSRRVATCAHS